MAEPRSGKGGNALVSAVALPQLNSLKVSNKANNHAYASNETNGHKKRVTGTKDRTGSFTLLDLPTFNEGDHITAVIKLDSSTTYKTMPIVIDNIDVTIDLDEGAPISYDVSFSGDGEPT